MLTSPRRSSGDSLSRRRFVTQALGMTGVVGMLGTHPLAASWLAPTLRQTSTDRVLVVIQLSGGNDGLNTVIPYRDEAYRKARPQIGIPEADVLKLDDDLGLHPACSGLMELIERGKLGIVQGVGYPGPNRSHFESMDLWHTCRHKEQRRREGWLGRYLADVRDQDEAAVIGIHLGREEQPLALASPDFQVPSLASIEEFRLRVAKQELLRGILQGTGGAGTEDDQHDLMAFLQTGTSAALSAGRRLDEILGSQHDRGEFPASLLGEKLGIIARLITAGLGTRVYYVTLDGFDTHALQPTVHGALLRQWSEALESMMKYLGKQGMEDQVLVLTFSEFGRRVAENASEGTDHGAAAPLFVAGGGVRAGLIGSHPRLDDLEDGDLKHAIDFREIYAAIIEDWFAVESLGILGAKYEKANLFASTH